MGVVQQAAPGSKGVLFSAPNRALLRCASHRTDIGRQVSPRPDIPILARQSGCRRQNKRGREHTGVGNRPIRKIAAPPKRHPGSLLPIEGNCKRTDFGNAGTKAVPIEAASRQGAVRSRYGLCDIGQADAPISERLEVRRRHDPGNEADAMQRRPKKISWACIIGPFRGRHGTCGGATENHAQPRNKHVRQNMARGSSVHRRDYVTKNKQKSR